MTIWANLKELTGKTLKERIVEQCKCLFIRIGILTYRPTGKELYEHVEL